ncbi:MAG: glycoside hydrolase family 5 protein, partial [Spirochaetaceae bacterium]|nr:glycoside hydrolase family 5 protein [Spirochaetaceae bacterium]
MKKLLNLLIIVCGLLTAVSCTHSSSPGPNEINENNENIYTVDLNSFEESNAEKTITFDKQTKIVTVSGEQEYEAVYAYLGLDISNYNIIRIKYKVLGDYGFHLIPDYDDESVEWEDREKNYCPSNLTEMVFPFIEGQPKLNGIALRGAWGASTKFKVDSITIEKVSNPVKTDVYASNEPPVIDTVTSGTINANLSAWDFVKTTGAGFQYSPLGFGPSDYEWGMDNYHPAGIAKPSKAMINLIKEKGFKTVRLQTNPGHGMILDKDYTVNPSYIKAIKEVVDWCIEEDLNVIICGPFAEHTVNPDYIKKIEEGNIHFAGYYVNEDYKAESLKFIEAVWKQYAQAFNNSYDEHLIFETFNEPIDVSHDDHAWLPKNYCADCQKDFALLNEYNQLVVDTIRSTGGNNANRFIMVESLAGNAEALADNLFTLPDDEAKNKLIPTFHFYQMGSSPEYSSMYYTNLIKQKALDILELLDEAYFSNEIPVYISEIGASRKISILERINCMKDFMDEVTKSNRSCGTILHSDNDVNALYEFHCYYDCRKLKWFDEEFLDTYIYGANNQEYVLSDEFIEEHEVEVESIVGKNLLK